MKGGGVFKKYAICTMLPLKIITTCIPNLLDLKIPKNKAQRLM